MYGDTYYTYADLTFNFCLKYMICFSYCVYRLSCVFFLWGNLPLQSYCSLSCDHGLHCSDEIMREQRQPGILSCFWLFSHWLIATFNAVRHSPGTQAPITLERKLTSGGSKREQQPGILSCFWLFSHKSSLHWMQSVIHRGHRLQ